MADLSLAAEFPAATKEDWLAAVDSVLKGASFDTVMRTPLADGFVIEPLYERAQGRQPIPGRPPGERWRIIQRVDHPEPDAANTLALADLDGGADGLSIVFAGAHGARGYGIAAETLASLDRALDGVVLDIITVRLDAGRRTRAAAALISALAQRRDLDRSRCRIAFGYDPLGILAVRGRLSAPWPRFEERITDLVDGLSAEGFTGPFLTMDGRPYHEAGASRATELAAMLATSVAYLRALDAGGVPLERTPPMIDAVLTADTDVFMTVAAIRALRLLWARLLELCGIEHAPLAVHAEQSWRGMARQDPWTNMLRGTVAAFAAGVGGADSVTVLPFNAGLGLPDSFGRRIARNAQHVLMAEAGLHRLDDPAAGAGAFEALTDELAEQAWRRFQAIEAGGGLPTALMNGHVQSLIAADRAATAPRTLVGVTRFQDPDQAPVVVLEPGPPALSARTRPPVADRFVAMAAAAADGASLGDLSPLSEPDGVRAPPLEPAETSAQGERR